MSNAKPGFFRRIWSWLSKPSNMALGGLLSIGIVIGLVGLFGFTKTVEYTSTNEFCTSCHEMDINVNQEYMMSTHFSNRSGMQATCSDCHVPHEFFPMVERKIAALREVYGHFTGIIDTPAKFEEHRRAMADREWARMSANDSQECRNCHIFDQMDLYTQKTVAATYHARMIETGQTCIDCHKGIAHTLPDMTGVPLGY